MTDQAVTQLIAVVVGGFLAIAGGFFTTTLLERQKQNYEARNLAFAFRGEITALIELIKERNYLRRFDEVAEQIEQTGKPFYMPIRIRFKYDRVYEANVGRLGILKPPLPESIPLYYTRLTSVLEDTASLGDGTYTSLDLATLVRVYRDMHALLQLSLAQGEQILQSIKSAYHLE